MKGESSADILLRAPIEPEAAAVGAQARRSLEIEKLTIRLETGPKPNRVTIDTGTEERVIDMAPSSQQTFELEMTHGMPYKPDPRFPTNYVYMLRISSSTGFVPMFVNGAQRQPVPRRDGPHCAHLRGAEVVATIAVVTSSPPFAEGGHLVMARELVRALREEGHDTGLVVTPQNRFGQQGSAYLAAWCTDVQLAHEERKVDQVISLRFPGYAVQHPNHVLWLNHRMREYYDLWDTFSSHLSWKGKIKERTRRAIIHRRRQTPLREDAAPLCDFRHRAGAPAPFRWHSIRRALSAAAQARLPSRLLR